MMKRLTLLLLVLAALAACSDDPVAPVVPGPVVVVPDTLGPITAVPLAIGDRWSYEVEWTVQILAATDGTDLYPPETRFSDGVKEIITTETLLGVRYQVERSRWIFDDGDSIVTYRRLRQDDTGLYRLLADLTAPPGALDGIERITETRRLEFPLDLGVAWTNSGGVQSRVTGKEMVDTVGGEAEAYRIRVISHRDRENDFIYVWFNEDGLVRRHNHNELHALDVTSGLEALVIIDETERIREAPPK